MADHDKADLDGDGEFDAIDLMILEDDEQEKKNGKDFLVMVMEISRKTASKLNSMKKYSKDPKKFVDEVKKVVSGEMDEELTNIT